MNAPHPGHDRGRFDSCEGVGKPQEGVPVVLTWSWCLLGLERGLPRPWLMLVCDASEGQRNSGIKLLGACSR